MGTFYEKVALLVIMATFPEKLHFGCKVGFLWKRSSKHSINDNVYNSFVWVTLGSFGIAGAEKVYKK